MKINYIYKVVAVTDTMECIKLSKEELKKIILSKDFFQVAPEAYVNLANIKEIDFVNSVIIFENGDKFTDFSKKIFV